MIKKDFFILMFVLTLHVAGWTQLPDTGWEPVNDRELQEWMNKIQTQFASETLWLEFSVRSFADYTTTLAADIETGSFLRSGSQSKSKLGSSTTYNNVNISVTVDHSERTVLISDPAGNYGEKWAEQWTDFLSRDCEMLQRSADGKTALRLIYPEGMDYAMTELVFENDMLSSSTVFYAADSGVGVEGASSPPRLECHFNKFRKNAEMDEAEISVNNVIRWSGDKILLQPAYKGFNLIDTRIR